MTLSGTHDKAWVDKELVLEYVLKHRCLALRGVAKQAGNGVYTEQDSRNREQGVSALTGQHCLHNTTSREEPQDATQPGCRINQPSLSPEGRIPVVPAARPRRSPSFRLRRTPKSLPRRNPNSLLRHAPEKRPGTRMCSPAAAGNEKKAYALCVESPCQVHMEDVSPLIGRWNRRRQ